MHTRKSQPWTTGEDNQLAIYVAQNLKTAKIANLMGRTSGSITMRKFTIGTNTKEKKFSVNFRNNRTTWQPSHDAKLLSLSKQGKCIDEIAQELGRTSASVGWRKSILIKNRGEEKKGKGNNVQEVHFEADYLYLPKTVSTPIEKKLVGRFIGCGGENIKQFQTKYEVTISVLDDTINISGKASDVDAALSDIKSTLKEPKIGDVFAGEVIGVKPFGSFIKVNSVYQGLLHQSKYEGLSPEYGNQLVVEVISFSSEGKIQFGIPDSLIKKEQPKPSPALPPFDVASEIEKMSYELMEKTGKKIILVAYAYTD